MLLKQLKHTSLINQCMPVGTAVPVIRVCTVTFLQDTGWMGYVFLGTAGRCPLVQLVICSAFGITYLPRDLSLYVIENLWRA
jgi:hypothetical protein